MRDPLETTMQKILDKKYATMKEIEDIQERIEVEIEACVKFAEESPYPEDDAVFEDIYVQQDYPFIKD